MKELSEEEIRKIVESRFDKLQVLKDYTSEYQSDEFKDVIARDERILDKLSPNWRDIEEVENLEIYKIKINEDELV